MDTQPNQNGEQGTRGTTRPIATFLTCAAGLLASLIRLVPHPANFSPVGALGLFGGARLRLWQGLALPLGIMVFTDLVLWMIWGFDPDYSPLHLSRIFVYGSFLLYVPIGRALIRGNSGWWIAGASLLGSLQFYLITNSGKWAMEPWSPPQLYTRDLSGLLNCLVAGLPFYQGDAPFNLSSICLGTDFRFGPFGTLLGDLIFSFGLFGLHAWLLRKVDAAEQVGLQPIPR
jgi:hypothetical protein